jgi:isocitrate/isopropylmalate dehydrogenase
MIKIAVAKGDGIGPELMDAVLTIFKAAAVPLEYEFVEMGKWVFDKGYSNGMTPAAKARTAGGQASRGASNFCKKGAAPRAASILFLVSFCES